MIAFLALIAACFVFARHFAASHHRISAAVSTATGAAFLAAWISTARLFGLGVLDRDRIDLATAWRRRPTAEADVLNIVNV
jgi:hypothetical protein